MYQEKCQLTQEGPLVAELRRSGPVCGVSPLASDGDQNASAKSVSFVPGANTCSKALISSLSYAFFLRVSVVAWNIDAGLRSRRDDLCIHVRLEVVR